MVFLLWSTGLHVIIPPWQAQFVAQALNIHCTEVFFLTSLSASMCSLSQKTTTGVIIRKTSYFQRTAPWHNDLLLTLLWQLTEATAAHQQHIYKSLLIEYQKFASHSAGSQHIKTFICNLIYGQIADYKLVQTSCLFCLADMPDQDHRQPRRTCRQTQKQDCMYFVELL